MDALRERDIHGAGHQQAESDGLRVAVGEVFVVGLGNSSLRQSFARAVSPALLRDFLDHLVAQQPAEPGGDIGQLFRVGRGDRLPVEEIVSSGSRAGGRGELYPVAFDVPVEATTLPTISPSCHRLKAWPSV